MAAPWLRFEAQTDAAHGPVLDGLMARAGLKPGQQVLDIGPGAGLSLIQAADAVGIEGHIMGFEIAPPFAARARQRVPDHVTLIEADAQVHDFEPDSFDAAISLFGVMFFADTIAAFQNIRRAMKPGAALHFACWGPPQANPWFSMPARVATEVFGPGARPDLTAPGPMRFHDPVALHALMTEAGWDATVDTQNLHLTPEGGPGGAAHMMMTIGAAASRLGMEKAERRLTDAQKTALRAALETEFAVMAQDGAVRVPAQIHFVIAVA